MADQDPLGIIGHTVAEKYQVEKLVGEGGFAVVYRATHAIWKKPVAIKFFSELSSAPINQRDELQQAFIQEGALLTELSSETAGIVQARDVGTFTTPDGRWMPFMVLEWLEGGSLEDLIVQDQSSGRGAWSLDQMRNVLRKAGQALDVAHGKGIAHRDIKPANIFVLGDARNPEVTVKLLDFGVAKMITDNTQMKAALAKTGTGITSFTPQYGAPEQFSRSYGATGPWTDVFALALVGVELLLGRAALDGDDVIQLAYSAGNGENRPTPRALGLSVPDAVEAVFARALAVAPAARYARAGEFVAALDAALAEVSAEERGAVGAVGERVALARTIAATDPSLAAASTAITAGHASNTTAMTAAASGPAPASGSKVLLLVGGAAALLVGVGAVVMVLRSPGEQPAAETPAPSASVPAAASAEPPPECPDGMVKIPGGEFYMGSDDPNAPDNEKPAHNVLLAPYCIDLHEVTRKAYLECSGRGACPRAARQAYWPNITKSDEKAYSQLCNEAAPERDDHPINCVTWQQADTYCKRQGKRLPTEAEWEFATRGPDGRIYPWGDDDPTTLHLNACDKDCADWATRARVDVRVLFENESDGFAATSPVGKYERGKSRFGPYDVVGNVWEWASDYKGRYTKDQARNPTGPESGERRVIRGGAWNGGDKSWLRPSFRYGSDPEVRSPAIGFRCAKPIE
ncbi:MAG: SUMF1/EgtB/PvdO family nonheme iron enzyme [Polyangiaceae bacterium]|nr:SUMF1/EgtB/PvdO family nonheme iron enzyme [Polyangiaceae bacterium]